MNTAERPPLLVAGAVIAVDGRILLTRRPPGSSFAGCWEFPGGKVEPGETVFGAAVRELREELAIAVKPVALHSSGRFETRTREIVLSAVEVEIERGQPRPTDGRDMGWFEIRRLRDLRFPPADRPILEALERDESGHLVRGRIWAERAEVELWPCRTGRDSIELVEPARLAPGWSFRRYEGYATVEPPAPEAAPGFPRGSPWE